MNDFTIHPGFVLRKELQHKNYPILFVSHPSKLFIGREISPPSNFNLRIESAIKESSNKWFVTIIGQKWLGIMTEQWRKAIAWNQRHDKNKTFIHQMKLSERIEKERDYEHGNWFDESLACLVALRKKYAQTAACNCYGKITNQMNSYRPLYSAVCHLWQNTLIKNFWL